MGKGEKKDELEPSELIGGSLNIFGMRIDLGELVGSPEKLTGRLEELREKLKSAGGREVLSDEEWRRGGASITGHIRTRGLLGEQEFHIGTMGKPRGKEARQPSPEPAEVVEPPVDVFDEEGLVTIVADVPGVPLEDLELKAEGSVFSLSTKAGARRRYQKELRIDADVEPESLQATCNNGVLEVRLRKRAKEDK